MVFKVGFYELEGWEAPHIFEFTKKYNLEVVSLSDKPIQEEKEETLKKLDIASVFIYSKLDGELFNRMKKLKLVATRSTGYDHIDLKAAKEKGVKVCNVPNYGDVTVAEYTIGLILSLLRRFKSTFERVSKGVFTREGLRGRELKGKTLGVVGTGRIGSKVIKLASAFEVKILAHDKRPNPELERKYGAVYVSLERLLSESDIVTLHVPYTPETHHLINRENIKLMKRGSYLINTSRGAVVDVEAVVEAIKEGRIEGVALDTFEGEEVWIEEELILGKGDLPATLLKRALESFYLLHWENAVLTPHNAYNTHEALGRILETTFENISSFLEKGRPLYEVELR